MGQGSWAGEEWRSGGVEWVNVMNVVDGRMWVDGDG